MRKVNHDTGTIYSRGELHEAFGLVENPDGWKHPINAVLPREHCNSKALHRIREAVIFYTGSMPTIEWETKSTVRVKAAGYYAVIGA